MFFYNYGYMSLYFDSLKTISVFLSLSLLNRSKFTKCLVLKFRVCLVFEFLQSGKRFTNIVPKPLFVHVVK